MNLYEMVFFEKGHTHRTQFVEDNDENAKKLVTADDERCTVMLLKHNNTRIHHYKWEMVGTKKFNQATGKFEWEDFDESKYENHTKTSDKH
ncbi:MAG TPA: hypothetical protein VKR58_14275 [Aquella sp.]|nr:hypothetical protein [Aquella sp.]